MSVGLFGAWADFSYYKSHVISSATGSGTNYQVMITVHYGTGTDSGDDVYLNSNTQTDFDDVAFFDNDQSTQLDCWLQEKTDSDNAIFWVEVADDLSSSAVTIYVLYGDADGTSQSDGVSTFIFFDDFDDGSLSSSTWDDTTYGTISGGVLIVEGDPARGTLYSVPSLSCNNGLSIMSYMKIGDSVMDRCGIWKLYYDINNQTNYYSQTGYSGKITIVSKDGGVQPATSPYDATFTVGAYKLLESNYESDYWDTKWDGSSVNTFTTYVTDYSTYAPQLVLSKGADNGDYMYFDWVAIRQFVSTEPAHSTWGTETSTVTAIIIDQINGFDVSDIEFYVP